MVMKSVSIASSLSSALKGVAAGHSRQSTPGGYLSTL